MLGIFRHASLEHYILQLTLGLHMGQQSGCYKAARLVLAIDRLLVAAALYDYQRF